MTYTTICPIATCRQIHIHTRQPQQDFFPGGWNRLLCVTTQHYTYLGDHTCQTCAITVPRCSCIAYVPMAQRNPPHTDSNMQPPNTTQPPKRQAESEPSADATKNKRNRPTPQTTQPTSILPYATMCTALNSNKTECGLLHFHPDKLKTKNNSAKLKGFYCKQCKTQRSLTSHICAACVEPITTCLCTIQTDAVTGHRTCAPRPATIQQPTLPHNTTGEHASGASASTDMDTSASPHPTLKRSAQSAELLPEVDDQPPDSGAAPSGQPTKLPRKHTKQKFTEITASHPFGTVCGTKQCNQTFAHVTKPLRETGSVRWPNWYCYKCQSSARMGNHTCRHCHQTLTTCICEVVPLDGGVTMQVRRRTQQLPWGTSNSRAVAPTTASPAKAKAKTTPTQTTPNKNKTKAPPPTQGNNLRPWLHLNAAPPVRRVFAKRARSRLPDALRPLTLGTDCSGMDAVAHAIKGLRIPLAHIFASDPDAAAREHMQANHTIQNLYTYLQERPTTHDNLDIYAAGPPCQPFSGIGAQQGLDDPRGKLYKETVDFILTARPKIFFIENVPGIKTFDKGIHLAQLIAMLTEAPPDQPNHAYNVTHHITNTRNHGIPHNRRRLYVIGIRKDCQTSPFVMPTDITPLTIQQLLGPQTPVDNINKRPSAPLATTIVNRLAAPDPLPNGSQHPTDYIIDDMVGDIRGANLEPSHSAPCFLHSRKQGFWVVTRGRRLTLAEALRLQGYNPDLIQCPTKPSQLYQLLGNTMSHNVVQRLIVAALHAAGLYSEIVDPWTNGTAQAELIAQAAKHVPTRYIVNQPNPPPEPPPDVINIDDDTDIEAPLNTTTTTASAIARIRHLFANLRAQRDDALTRREAREAHHNSITTLRMHRDTLHAAATEPTTHNELRSQIRSLSDEQTTTGPTDSEMANAPQQENRVGAIRQVFQHVRQATAPPHPSFRKYIAFQSTPSQHRNLRRRLGETQQDHHARQQSAPPAHSRPPDWTAHRRPSVHGQEARDPYTHPATDDSPNHGRPPQPTARPRTLRSTSTPDSRLRQYLNGGTEAQPSSPPHRTT